MYLKNFGEVPKKLHAAVIDVESEIAEFDGDPDRGDIEGKTIYQFAYGCGWIDAASEVHHTWWAGGKRRAVKLAMENLRPCGCSPECRAVHPNLKPNDFYIYSK